jgi:hypothetical protein
MEKVRRERRKTLGETPKTGIRNGMTIATLVSGPGVERSGRSVARQTAVMEARR